MLSVMDVMSKKVLEVDRQTSIKKSAQLMANYKVGSLIIMDHNQPVGIATETDFTRDVVATNIDIEQPVSKIMSSPLFSSSPDADIMEVANSMKENNIKKVPVFDGNKIVGIVTQSDLIRHVFRSMHLMHSNYEQGHLTPEQLVMQTSDLFKSFHPALEHLTKNWYMKCEGCGYKFLDAERDGKLEVKNCPKCQSRDIIYDMNPEI